MSGRFWLSMLVSCLIAAPCMAASEVQEGDAFARADADDHAWTIGTAAVQMKFACSEGRFQLVSFRNTLTEPAREYASASAPWGVEALSAGPFAVEKLWSKPVLAGSPADPAADNLRLSVKRGDLIGFGAAIYSDDAGAALDWATALDYGDGEKYASPDDAELAQGPVWYYYAAAPGTGSMDALGEMLPAAAGQSKGRVPSGYRAPAECPSLGATRYQLKNAYELVRVWKAPKDGLVSVHGAAEHAGGFHRIQVSVYRIADKAAQPIALPDGYDRWTLESGDVRQVAVGGRPAVQLSVNLNRDGLRAHLYVQAYPGTSILRQWVELENATASALTVESPAPLSLGLRGEDTVGLTHYWMCGGTSRPNQGQLEQAEVGETYHRTLLGDRSDNYVPWMALARQQPGAPGDGLFVALDHLGTWTLGLDCAAGQGVLSASFPELAERSLAPGERLRLPLVTLGVFNGDLDDMGRRVYDWQYQYLWDYTNSDYYARTKWVVPWFFCSRNLQEQFAARLAWLDMDADLMRTMGMEMLWDDAGWSKYPGWPIENSYAVVFSPSFEGPDYAETLRYLGKMDMQWLLWMAGRPTAGLLDTKVGSWGNFQWRTDGFGRFGLDRGQAVCQQIEHFLRANPRCSFHTCCGGSRYAHQFEIQRYADVNYLSDMGRGDQTNHYLSYLELPDKWTDLLEALLQPGAKYNPDTGPGLLSMTPGWYLRADGPEQELLRRVMEIYRYLRQEGVAGRWSHMMHPVIQGDTDYYYDQRICFDGTKACIIPKHRAKGEVVIYPKGLLPEHDYEIGYEFAKDRATRSGADLMANGLLLKDPAPGELIYLGLPDLPGFARGAAAPKAPGQAFACRETNLGHSGVGLYWSPGAGNGWVSYYEIRRNEATIGKASTGTYYFDHDAGWDVNAAYAVRSVDGNGQTSAWTPAKTLAGASPAYAALGGHFAQPGRDGWSAESTADEHTFTGMTWGAARQQYGGRSRRHTQSTRRGRRLLGGSGPSAGGPGLAAGLARGRVRAGMDRAGAGKGDRHWPRDEGVLPAGDGRSVARAHPAQRQAGLAGAGVGRSPRQPSARRPASF